MYSVQAEIDTILADAIIVSNAKAHYIYSSCG